MQLSQEDYVLQRKRHRSRVAPWASDRVKRQNHQKPHPVYDFLFSYYSYRPAALLRWSPGLGVTLRGVVPSDTDWPEDYVETGAGCILNAERYAVHRIKALQWVINYQRIISERQPRFACFGLHEWAMVYRDGEVRHSVPLRVSRTQIASVVDELSLGCTHFDAFRFFTAQAGPLNKVQLSRETTSEHDQAGCIHVTMDLYKFAYKASPFVSSDLIADAFELAAEARAVDMRASPYDLSELGFEPIAIETKEGRAQYVIEQQALSAKAAPIRLRLIGELERLLSELNTFIAKRSSCINIISP